MKPRAYLPEPNSLVATALLLVHAAGAEGVSSSDLARGIDRESNVVHGLVRHRCNSPRSTAGCATLPPPSRACPCPASASFPIFPTSAARRPELTERTIMNAPEAMVINLPHLNEGERYAGLLLDDQGAPSHHLILLPGDQDEAPWHKATEWAASIGGELPTRREQALLYANLPSEFKQDWYWSGTQHAAYSGSAWSQRFLHGGQLWDGKYDKLRARAVRRIPIK